MVQYLGNVLKYDRLFGRKSGLERLRMFLNAAPPVHSNEKADGAGCDEKTKSWDEDMKEKVGGWWW
jgi:hypothetical protein